MTKQKQPPALTEYEKQQKEIGRIAYQLRLKRIKLGQKEDLYSDWKMAEEIAKSPRKRMLFAIHQPFVKAEKNFWEPLLQWANNQALLSLLSAAGNVGILIAAITFMGTEEQRRNAEILKTWQTLISVQGKPGSGGRVQMLEFLNASPGANWRLRFPWICIGQWCPTWPAESLDGINLTVDRGGEEEEGERGIGVYLAEIQLPNASLSSANLKGADLWQANLEGASLGRANLQDANLTVANLQGADLFYANLQDVHLGGANLQGADLTEVNLQGAELGGANLQGAILSGANLQDAYLRGANLQDAILEDTNLQDAILEDTNLQDAILLETDLTNAEFITTEQLTQAKLCQTILPEGIDLDPNRDCKALEEEWGIDLTPDP